MSSFLSALCDQRIPRVLFSGKCHPVLPIPAALTCLPEDYFSPSVSLYHVWTPCSPGIKADFPSNQLFAFFFLMFSVIAKQLCYKLTVSTSDTGGGRGRDFSFCFISVVFPVCYNRQIHKTQWEAASRRNGWETIKSGTDRRVTIKLFLKHTKRKEVITIKCDLSMWHNLLVVSSKTPVR